MMDHDAGRLCLLELHEVLELCGLPFFLMQGTALGAVRDRGFVPSEKDIDLGVLYDRFHHTVWGLLRKLEARGFDAETVVAPFTRIRTVVVRKDYNGHHIKADIVSFARWKGRRFACSPVRPWKADPYAIVHPAERLESYRTAELFGQSFRVPADAEGYLEAEYGPDWRTPADDHVSRTRVYNFVEKEGVPRDLLER